MKDIKPETVALQDYEKCVIKFDATRGALASLLEKIGVNPTPPDNFKGAWHEYLIEKAAADLIQPEPITGEIKKLLDMMSEYDIEPLYDDAGGCDPVLDKIFAMAQELNKLRSK